MFEKFVAGGIVVLSLLVVLALLVTLPIQMLWNCLCPALFGLPSITFWQALGLFTLLRCLFPQKVK